MKYIGNLSKMNVFNEDPVHYYLTLNEQKIDLNRAIGRKVSLRFTGRINCVDCGTLIKKPYGQGFCYPCFLKSPLNSECIIRPELCQAHMGKGRNPEWEEQNHNKPHIVYLALTSNVKVGVTRKDQVPVRWIDQGAWKAIQVAETPYRQIAGKIEISLKQILTDKTNWQKMLKNEMNTAIDLQEERKKVVEQIAGEFRDFLKTENQDIYTFNYPVAAYPEKITSLNPEKNPVINAILTGIRGQYLFFDTQAVINIRNYSGYEIEFSAE